MFGRKFYSDKKEAREMRNSTKYYPSPEQRDPSRLTTEEVQFWYNGLMMGLLSLEEAREKVRRGEAFVITSQAIGALNEDGSSNS